LLVKIANFKNIESAELKQASVTTRMGPLASGKSNIKCKDFNLAIFNEIMLLGLP